MTLTNRSRALGPSVGRNLAHVPEDRAARVDVGGADHHEAALRVFHGDFFQELLGHGLARERPQGRVVGHGVAEDALDDATRLDHVLWRNGGIEFLERRVVFRPQEGEWRDQPSRADAGDELEFGPGPRRRPPVEQPCGERAVVAAAGDGQVHRRGQRSLVAPVGEVLLLAAQSVEAGSEKVRHVPATDVTHPRHPRDLGLRRQRGRHRVQPWRRRQPERVEQPSHSEGPAHRALDPAQPGTAGAAADLDREHAAERRGPRQPPSGGRVTRSSPTPLDCANAGTAASRSGHTDGAAPPGSRTDCIRCCHGAASFPPTRRPIISPTPGTAPVNRKPGDWFAMNDQPSTGTRSSGPRTSKACATVSMRSSKIHALPGRRNGGSQ